MKYLKLFESLDDLVNKISEQEYEEWFENHNPIVPSEVDLSKVKKIIESTILRESSMNPLMLHVKKLCDDYVKIIPCPGEPNEKLIYINVYPCIPEKRNQGLDIIAIWKFNDEWRMISQHVPGSSNNRYIVDGLEGIEKFFKQNEIS